MKLLPLLLLAVSLAAGAQAQGKLPRLCFLAFEANAAASDRFKPFFDGLRDIGYVDGRTITIDARTADSDPRRYPALAAECVANHADIIVVATTPAAQAAMKATATIPIVMHPLADPVGTGLIKSLARPGGNVTGLSFMGPALSAKRLDLLKQALPTITRVLLLTHLADPIAPLQVAETRKAAERLGIRLVVHDVRVVDDIARGLAAGAKEGVEAVMTTSESIFVANRAHLVALAAAQRLPSMGVQHLYAEAGMLLSFGVDYSVFSRRTGMYVDRILKGAKPADLPVEQPTRFELVVNQKVAKSLGIRFPESFMLQVDRVIE